MDRMDGMNGLDGCTRPWMRSLPLSAASPSYRPSLNIVLFVKGVERLTGDAGGHVRVTSRSTWRWEEMGRDGIRNKIG